MPDPQLPRQSCVDALDGSTVYATEATSNPQAPAGAVRIFIALPIGAMLMRESRGLSAELEQGAAALFAGMLAGLAGVNFTDLARLSELTDAQLEELTRAAGQEGRRRGWGDYWLDDIEYGDVSGDA